MPRVSLLALVLLAGCAGTRPDAPAPSTGPLAPGDTRLDFAAVSAPSAHTYAVSIRRDGQSQPFGTLTETIRRAPDGTVTRVERLDSPRGAQIDSLTAGPDFSPRSHDSRNPGRTISLRYGPGTATGTYTETGVNAIPVRDSIPLPAFDSNFISLVARAVPLTAGFTATVRTYERGSADPEETSVPYTVTVLGPQPFDGRDAVAVEFGKAGGATTRYYLDPETRTLLRHESEVGPGVTLVIEPS